MGTDEDDLLKLVEERDHYDAEMEKYSPVSPPPLPRPSPIPPCPAPSSGRVEEQLH